MQEQDQRARGGLGLHRGRWRAVSASAAVVVLGLVGVPAAVLAFQNSATGFVEICKTAEGPNVTGTFRFTVAGVITDVPAGACSPVIEVPAGTVTVVEEERAGIMVSRIETNPISRLVGSNADARSAQVQVVAGDQSTQSTVTFFNRAVVAVLKVCKVAGEGVAVGTSVSYTAGTAAATVPAGPPPGGHCVVVGWFPVATNVPITETIPTGAVVSSITVAPPDRLVGSPNLTGGSVVVRIGPGVTEATFTNEEEPPPSLTTTTVAVTASTSTTVPTGSQATTTLPPGGGPTTTLPGGGSGSTTTLPSGGSGATTTVPGGGAGATTTSTTSTTSTTTSPTGLGPTTTRAVAGSTTSTAPGGGGATTTTPAGAGPSTTKPGASAPTTVGPAAASTTVPCHVAVTTIVTPTSPPSTTGLPPSTSALAGGPVPSTSPNPGGTPGSEACPSNVPTVRPGSTTASSSPRLATTGRRVGRLLLLGCVAALLGGLLVRAEPRVAGVRIGALVALAARGVPRRPQPTGAGPGRCPRNSRRDDARDDAQPEADQFPALTFVPVVVEDPPAGPDAPMRLWGLVEPD